MSDGITRTVHCTEFELAVFEQAMAALKLPLSARELWFIEIAHAMARANLRLGWNGLTAH